MTEGLSPIQARLVERLLQEPGRVVPHTALWTAAGLNHLPNDFSRENNVKVHVCRARKALAGNVEIHNVCGIGYRAVLV